MAHEFPFVRGITKDGRVLDGVVLKNSVMLTTACELAKAKHVLPVSEVSDIHPLHLPVDCPVCGVDQNRTLCPGFWRGNHVECLDGKIVPLGVLVGVFPATIGVTGLSFTEMRTSKLHREDYTTISTAKGLWLVPKVWGERYVDTWFA